MSYAILHANFQEKCDKCIIVISERIKFVTCSGIYQDERRKIEVLFSFQKPVGNISTIRL